MTKKKHIGECKLCQKEKPLHQSHIIPEFMYLNLYDQNPKRFYEVRPDEKKQQITYQQKGKRERLLCGACETLLSQYEQYADENLYGKNNRAEAVLIDKVGTPDGKFVLSSIEGFNYKKMKLFLDGLLFRMLVCTSFPTPAVPAEQLEKLRLSVWKEQPLGEEEFPCVIHTILKANHEILGGFIIEPRALTYKHYHYLSTIIDGMDFRFYLSDKIPKGEDPAYLTTKGTLKFIGQPLSEWPELIRKISPLHEGLKKHVQPPMN